MKTLNWNVWGTNHPITFRLSRYASRNECGRTQRIRVNLGVYGFKS